VQPFTLPIAVKYGTSPTAEHAWGELVMAVPNLQIIGGPGEMIAEVEK
jgi:hypothetical protein